MHKAATQKTRKLLFETQATIGVFKAVLRNGLTRWPLILIKSGRRDLNPRPVAAGDRTTTQISPVPRDPGPLYNSFP